MQLPPITKSSETVTFDEQPKTATESKAAAIAAIKKLGGSVTFDEENPGKPVVGVDFFNTQMTDAGLVHLKDLTSLQELSLEHSDAASLKYSRYRHRAGTSQWDDEPDDAGSLIHPGV
jgi:hypothetical protein